VSEQGDQWEDRDQSSRVVAAPANRAAPVAAAGARIAKKAPSKVPRVGNRNRKQSDPRGG
jgi:hypothetical protein